MKIILSRLLSMLARLLLIIFVREYFKREPPFEARENEEIEMAVQSTQLFSMLDKKMSWLTQRQRVVAQNIANADTPYYRSSDLKPLEFSKALRIESEKLHVVSTSNRHQQPKAGPGDFKIVTERLPYETAPTGNGVVIEEQMLKMNDTYQQYNLSTSIFKKYTSMYKTALGRR